jgi:hypothetical protein
MMPDEGWIDDSVMFEKEENTFSFQLAVVWFFCDRAQRLPGN